MEKRKPNAEVAEKRKRTLRNNILPCVLGPLSPTSAFHALHRNMAVRIVRFRNPYVQGLCRFPSNSRSIRSLGIVRFAFMNNPG